MINSPDLLGASILIVDDQEANVLLLEQVLSNAGYTQVTGTTDPFAVCAMHQEHHYDLILLDLQMPGMSGFQVLEALKAIEPDGYVPVLVITAQPSHKLHALQAGAKDFVSKPFELVEVETRIRNMLEVRLLHRQLNRYNQHLEETVIQRTAELRASEARFQRFAELSTDWYWEQDVNSKLTNWSGPVTDMVGIGHDSNSKGWDPAEKAQLEQNIAERKPFLDFIYSRTAPEGIVQYLQVSGEPIFDESSRFVGYRGVGRDITQMANKLKSKENIIP
ncbi:response regulator [Rugamonas sp.]|uniref:response regulator n=1 Tax=Rugamonas sp. TaxID=1926287 RepID=UPI0025E27221|nr:response regulator [Rugamonas sp.]